ncbi:MAG: DUF2332 domain-containing protein [Actinobacteria bacterium]|nr:DUF2332 domain-containing protein [Actinomycetota bacterium]
MDTADWYRGFADREVRGVSPLYQEFALEVAQDADVLAFLRTLPEAKRQPNLLLGAVKYLTGVLPDYGAYFVVGHQDDLRDLMSVRSTQTNEPGRCAVLLPLLAALTQPIALEVGAAAGLCLLPDRHRYDYGGRRVGPADSPVTFACEPRGSVPVPEAVPEVAWRLGVDLHPLDVTDPDTGRWLRALVWAGDVEREDRLRAALQVASKNPPPVASGDLLSETTRLAATAPPNTTVVVFHSAVMPYLSSEDRTRFNEIVSGLSATWISFEGLGVLPDIDARLMEQGEPDSRAFVLARDGELVALASLHGRWVRWGAR